MPCCKDLIGLSRAPWILDGQDLISHRPSSRCLGMLEVRGAFRKQLRPLRSTPSFRAVGRCCTAVQQRHVCA